MPIILSTLEIRFLLYREKCNADSLLLGALRSLSAFSLLSCLLATFCFLIYRLSVFTRVHGLSFVYCIKIVIRSRLCSVL